MDAFTSQIPQEELNKIVNDEAQILLKQLDSSVEWPKLQKTKDVSKGDFCLVVGPIAGKKKVNPAELAKQVSDDLNKLLASNNKSTLIQRAEAAAGYVNVYLNRAVVFTKTIKKILNAGDSYGTSDEKKSKTVIVEHTSANPIGPLHIGNLRNVIIGSTLSKILKSVGYTVKQHFYVNDLGYQIGLTAIGFIRVYSKLQPTLKMDQWIGLIYAMMNTFSELQLNGVSIHVVNEMIEKGKKPEEELANDKNREGLKEYVEIFRELKERQSDLFNTLIKELKDVPDIKKSASEMNLSYERNEPEAVKLFRHMVISCLSGMQETLDIYGVKHDVFDFESELGWEGSNDRVISIMKASPYYVGPTQSNQKGVPEGGYFDLDKFIKDRGLPQGKKGYQPDYPKLYVVRPDYSTLYTFRDVVYSLKKESQADMVLNIIASEQNLAQEKVSLALELLHPGQPQKQFHISYELVKLEGKMSSRRARYVLADDVFEDLKLAIKELMDSKTKKKGKPFQGNYDQVVEEVSTAAVKYALTSISFKSLLVFDKKRATNPEDSSAPFLLYNATRFFSMFRKYEAGVAANEYPPLPSIDQVDFSLLKEPGEWDLLMTFLIHFPSLIYHIGCPTLPDAPGLPDFPVHLLPDFLISLVRAFSKYWVAVKILNPNPTKEESEVLFARLYLLKALQIVLNNGLRMLTMTPLERM